MHMKTPWFTEFFSSPECEISDFIPQLAAILDQSKITDLLPVPNFILAGSYCSQVQILLILVVLVEHVP